MDKTRDTNTHFDKVYEHLEIIKKRFMEIQILFSESDKQIEEIRVRHEEMKKKFNEELEKRDMEIADFLKRKEREEVKKLIEDVGYLIDEMHSTRLKLLEEEKELKK